MTLHVEAEVSGEQKYIPIGVLQPGEQPGSLSQNLPDGVREIYLFSCSPDNSHSLIQKSTGGMDMEISELRALVTTDLETVAELHANESYTLDLLTDKGTSRRAVRFTHKDD